MPSIHPISFVRLVHERRALEETGRAKCVTFDEPGVTLNQEDHKDRLFI